jgi:putative ABC transport system substrate-binding protein
MKRREFITLLGSAAAAWPLAARAQVPTSVIGFLNLGSPGAFGPYVGSLWRAMNEAGYFEGRNVKVEYRWAQGRNDQLPVLAAELRQRGVSAIVAAASAVALAARKEYPNTPIVFVVGDDPVRVGLVETFQRPGRNATGATLFSLATAAKRVELLHEIAPSTAPIAVLLNPNGAMAHVELSEAQTAAQALGRRVQAVNIDSARALDAMSSAIADLRPGSLLVTTDPLLTNRAADVVALAERLQIPANYPLRAFTEAGGLMSYGASLHDAYWQVGRYLARVIKGEQAAELPVVQPAKFELILNLKTAKALGLDVSPTLLALADEVIE